MQYAQRPQPRHDMPFPDPSAPSCPQSASDAPPPHTNTTLPPRTGATPPPSDDLSLSSANISKAIHRQAAAALTLPSPPPSPPKGTSTSVQCNGWNKTGQQQRCSRKIKCELPLAALFPDAEVEALCHSHLNNALEPKGINSHQKPSQYIDFSGSLIDIYARHSGADQSFVMLKIGSQTTCTPKRKLLCVWK